MSKLDRIINPTLSEEEKPDYSLLLYNLYTAFYKKKGNPYTKHGNVFGYHLKKTGVECDNLLAFHSRSNNPMPFLSYEIYYREIIGGYASTIKSDKYSANQERFLLSHMGGWRDSKSEIMELKDPLVHDNNRGVKAIRPEFSTDLSTWMYRTEKTNAGKETYVFFKENESLAMTLSKDAKYISEYIVACNYILVSKYCLEKSLLRMILGKFIENMVEAESVRMKRKENSLLPHNLEALECLHDSLAKLLSIYDNSDNIEEKDWLLARMLGWLIIGAMLREEMSLELLKNHIVRYIPNTDDNGLAEDVSTDADKRIKECKGQILKINILIPLEYNRDIYEENADNKGKAVKTHRKKPFVQSLETKEIQSIEWFLRCFQNKPIEATFQNVNSPLITDPNYIIQRIELQSTIRTRIGLSHNENTTYRLTDNDNDFQIKKIRILFTKSFIAFLHLEILAFNINGDNILRFINAFSRITSRQPKFTYRKRIKVDCESVVEITLKDIINNTIALQQHIVLSTYEGRITPYFQICLIGSCDQNEKMSFFESIRSLSKRESSKQINGNLCYVGKEPYISRFVGDRSLNIFGDTEVCGNNNLPFLTDYRNGLIKSATENYLPAYAFLVSLRLLSRKQDLSDSDLNYLLKAPFHLSDEDNIREFLEKCLLDNGWCLKNSISIIRENIRRSFDQQTITEIRRMNNLIDGIYS